MGVIRRSSDAFFLKIIYNAAALAYVSIVEITETGIYQTFFQ
jgi:hypothetical protein